ncbi:hypothetical protein SmJEL517_g05327 [Synchytrium microbalum]|uniref:Alpha/beta hydrolase fold-3 domain-containing protein n=1 Tax=Synchytrium microbalum TaxID=1806994 RepID=A0A507BVX7_9FUNG|nr:uncharacterized protein SmJEL517_g05327 [Synchytrium microbalum]TPX31291.1 hypothetical protein SmJEL517_g05327 [Synchytrium microbalum]
MLLTLKAKLLRFLLTRTWIKGHGTVEPTSVEYIDISVPNPIDALLKNPNAECSYKALPTRILIFFPENYNKLRQESWPVHIDLHGGGFFAGVAEQDSTQCKLIADKANCIIISVDYVKAPEYPFPAAAEQVFSVFKWLVDEHRPDGGVKLLNVDVGRVTVGGWSAGANLGSVMCIMAHDRPHLYNSNARILLQIPVYPPPDLYESYADRMNLYDKESDLFKKSIPIPIALFMLKCYNPRGQTRAEAKALNQHPYMSPVYASEAQLRFVPNALVLNGEWDVLGDWGVVYAETLKKAGVHVVTKRYPKAVHGWNGKPKGDPDHNSTVTEDTYRIMIEELRRVFQRKGV